MEASAAERRRIVRGARNREHHMDVPAFGDWDFLQNDRVPITQYFDFCHSPTPRASVYPYTDYFSPADALFLHYHDFQQLQQQYYRPCRYPTSVVDQTISSETGGGRRVKGECGTRGRRRRRQQQRSCLENKSRVFDFDTTATLTETYPTHSDGAVCGHSGLSKSKNNAKAKDEDLYKISPELLRSARTKKKMSMFFRKCFVSICASY